MNEKLRLLGFRVIAADTNYAVSYDGFVVRLTSRTSAKAGSIVKSFLSREGYVRVSLTRKKHLLHRLVAAAFLESCPTRHVVNHKDGNKLNNNAENLEYVTQRENITHGYETGLSPSYGETHGMAKLIEKEIVEIKAATGDCHLCSKLAAKYGVCRSMIWNIRAGRSWKHVA